jgi:phosphatidylserine/phosphatidylglycerophosphate/cardiolipin synthase-like enzyme
MTLHSRLQDAVTAAAASLGPGLLRDVADAIEQQRPASAVVAATATEFASLTRAVLDACATIPETAAVAYLRGVADGYAHRAAAVTVESVWSGPGSHAVPVRSTAAVLVEIVRAAREELLLTTYSAAAYPPLADALRDAVARGVVVSVVVETLQGAGSALNGAEPALAFADVPGVELWHWPVGNRTEQGAKMHAKLAVADRRMMFVSSANLTQSGVSRNIEAGVLVRGGAAPRRAAEHIAELISAGVLARLSSGGR